MFRHLRSVMCSAVALAAGCSDTKAPPVPQPTAPVAATATTPSADVRAAPVESNPEVRDKPAEEVVRPAAVSQPSSAAPVTQDTAEPAAPEARIADKTKSEERPSPERIAILTPGGPLLVDVRITIGGKPLATAFEALVQHVLEVGDSDHDGRSTWKELVADRAYLEKEMPKAPAADSRQMKTLIERYDGDRDGKIQPSEAAAWLGRDAGATAKPLAVRSTRVYRPAPRAASQVWQMIDADGDGQLTAEEIQGASNHLLSLDADDDRILAPTEMASLREQLEAAGQSRSYVSRESNHYAVLHLEPDLEIDRLNYLLCDLYTPQQDLRTSSFSELTEAYKKLDANGDGWLDADELAAMRTADPHLRLGIAFSATGDKNPATATVEVKTLTPEIGIVVQPSADRAVITLGNTRLIISAHDLPAAPDAEPNDGRGTPSNQIRLMVHDKVDALFEELDANADGRLGEREIEFCSQRLADRDRDGDGQLSGDEFPYSMIVAFLRGEQASERSFYVPPSATTAAPASDKPLPSWYLHADLNGDGDVSRREFLGSTEQFDRLDADKDGYVGTSEAAP